MIELKNMDALLTPAHQETIRDRMKAANVVVMQALADMMVHRWNCDRIERLKGEGRYCGGERRTREPRRTARARFQT